MVVEGIARDLAGEANDHVGWVHQVASRQRGSAGSSDASRRFRNTRLMTRRSRIGLFAAIILALSLLAGCGDDGDAVDTAATTATSGPSRAVTEPPLQPGLAQTHALTESDSGSTVRANVGDRIRITLEECQSCGFQWKEVKAPDANVVKPYADRRVEPTTSTSGPPMPGGSSSRVFLYFVVGQGRTGGTLGYFGPGDDPESGDGAQESFTFKVDAATVAGSSVGSKTWSFDEADDEMTVTVAKGDKIYVTLYACGPCGEAVEVTKAPDAKILREDPNADKSTTTTTRDPDNMIVGGGSDEIWGWDAVGAGKTVLEINWQAWGEDGLESREDPYRLTVIVK